MKLFIILTLIISAAYSWNLFLDKQIRFKELEVQLLISKNETRKYEIMRGLGIDKDIK